MPGSMDTAGVPMSTANSPAFQQPFATPSPFYNSVASTSVGSPAFRCGCNLVLRFLAFCFSFAAVVAVVATSDRDDDDNYGRAGCETAPSSFRHSPEFRYWISATIISSLYSALQLCKGIRDIAFRGSIISDKMSDYITSFLDQIVAYLLLSSSSVVVLATKHIKSKSFKSVLIVSNCFSIIAFLVVASCTFLSCHNVYKRIIW
ncbi:hypothetical protein Taro_026787 [Colocasia esculenta]|uniref:CASP-like protein n=1 Tax=Colocasia esculenta TaxID=4460 RepID=A0A843VPN2_COLES|nr:hypothetical protein [Colocasia esculenta]